VTRVVSPGSIIGILGGGQLGRMFAMAARRIGYRQDQSRLLGDGPILHFTLSGVNMNGPSVEPPLSEF
jgi:hypothetical protein